MAQLCTLINERFNNEQSYNDATSLFLPYNTNLCEAVASWPYTLARNFSTEFADPLRRGKRMAEYLRYAKNKYLLLIPQQCQIMDFLIQRSELGLTSAQASAVVLLAGVRGAVGFERVSNTSRFEFPQDFGWNYRIQTEKYWFATNTFILNQKLPLSFNFIIVRHSLVPQSFWGTQSGDAYSIYEYSYRLTVPFTNQVYQNNITVDGAWQVDSMQLQPFFIGAGDSFGMKSLRSDGFLFPLELWCVDTPNNINVKLQLIATKSVVPWNPAFNVGQSSVKYYAWPRIHTLSGTIVFGDQSLDVDTGYGSMSHELGSETQTAGYANSIIKRAINNIKSRYTISGLESGTIRNLWFGFNLANNTDITGYLYPAPVPDPTNLGPFPIQGAFILDNKNQKVDVQGTITFDKYITSPTTGALYPYGMTISVPSYHLQFRLVPTFVNAFSYDMLDVEYYSAGVVVSGSSAGLGFVELYNYIPIDQIITSRLKLLDFENSDKLLPYFLPQRCNLPTFIASILLFVVIVIFVILIVLLILFLAKRH